MLQGADHMDIISDCVVIYGSWLQGAQGTPEPFLDNRRRFVPAVLQQMSMAFRWAGVAPPGYEPQGDGSSSAAEPVNIDAKITVLARSDVRPTRAVHAMQMFLRRGRAHNLAFGWLETAPLLLTTRLPVYPLLVLPCSVLSWRHAAS